MIDEFGRSAHELAVYDIEIFFFKTFGFSEFVKRVEVGGFIFRGRGFAASGFGVGYYFATVGVDELAFVEILLRGKM